MSGAARRWNETFDRMHTQLDEVTRALDAGDVTGLPAFQIPVGLPPVPPICVDRARGLVARHRELEAEVREQLAASQPNVQRRRPAPASASRAARFEVRA